MDLRMKIVKKRATDESEPHAASPSRTLPARKGTPVGSTTGEVAVSDTGRKRGPQVSRRIRGRQSEATVERAARES